jgi:hypothetical protein
MRVNVRDNMAMALESFLRNTSQHLPHVVLVECVVYHGVDFGADDAQGLFVWGVHALEHCNIADTAVCKLGLLL